MFQKEQPHRAEHSRVFSLLGPAAIRVRQRTLWVMGKGHWSWAQSPSLLLGCIPSCCLTWHLLPFHI